MYRPPPRWGWARYLVWSAAGVLLLIEFAERYLPHHAAPSAAATRPRTPSFGRVTIPNIPPDSDARFDDAILPITAQRPDANAIGCWRYRGLGNDAGTMDRVECRLEGDTVHLFEVRHRNGGEPELWRITIPGENGESILVH